MNKPIYLDYNATTPHDAEVIAAMRPYLEEHFGNPSSSHWYGIQTRNAIEHAREQVASLLNCLSKEIIFTSGGTEANNYAIRGIAGARKSKGNHIITTEIEHPAVLEVCRYLEKNGFEVTYLPVDESGLVSVSDVEKAITPQTILITIMHANNEVGTVQPIEQISTMAKDHGIIVHTDAAQSAGKIPVDVNILGVDLLSIAGHKVYAPKGIGALYVRQGVELESLLYGAGHEQGRRPGTENVLEIVGLGTACEIAGRNPEKNTVQMKKKRDRLFEGLKVNLKSLRLNGHPERRLPNTLSLSFLGVEANQLLSEIGDNVAASAGAACHSGGVEVSHVLKAMNIPVEWAKGTVRFSTGRMTTESEIDKAVEVISEAVRRLQTNSEVPFAGQPGLQRLTRQNPKKDNKE
ncbi:MAG: cysteine desulfurase NifS [Chloroflexi bacterium RBG_13_60_9]|nr:MAG: cysteine desulfurase NifS [Chloroflexi bacterium RBG_13_60_9]